LHGIKSVDCWFDQLELPLFSADIGPIQIESSQTYFIEYRIRRNFTPFQGQVVPCHTSTTYTPKYL
jgi:hypothetical protein